MPFGIGIGQVVALVRETRAIEDSAAVRSRVSGAAGARARGGARPRAASAAAVVVGGDPLGAAVVVRLLEAEPSAAERIAILRSRARRAVPLIVAAPGGRARSVRAARRTSLDLGPRAADRRARRGDRPRRAGRGAAARRPAAGPAARRRAAARSTLTSSRMRSLAASDRTTRPAAAAPHPRAEPGCCCCSGVSRGDPLPRDPQELALAAGPPVAASLGLGFGSRTLVRRLPDAGRRRPGRRRLRGHAGARRGRLRVP